MSRNPAEIGHELRESVAAEKKLRREADNAYRTSSDLERQADEEQERGEGLRKQLLDAVAPPEAAPPKPPPGPPDPPRPPLHRPVS